MKVTDFCKFFDFSIEAVPANMISDEEKKDLGLTKPVIYVMTDDQGTFQDRLVDDIKDVVNCFDSMLTDYIEETIEQFGYVYDEKSSKTYYEQALEWIVGSQIEGSDTHDVIKCMVYPQLLENDLSLAEPIAG